MKDPNAMTVTKRRNSFGPHAGQNTSEASVQNAVIARPKLQRFAKLAVDKLLWDLPKNLAAVIGKDPTNIIKADTVSLHPDDGFNVYMWKNGDEFKLYLENRNIAGNINPATQITYADVQDLAQRVDPKSKQPLPTSIVIKTRNFNPSMWEAKKMVMDLLGAHRKSSASTNDFSVIKERTVQPLPNGTVTIMFSVKSAATIMTRESLLAAIKNAGGVATIPDLLSAYQQNLRKGVQNFRRVEAQAALQAITEAARSLEQALADLIPKMKGFFSNKPELPTLTTLQQQVTAAIKDGFKDELDTVRWQEWGKYNPFTEDQVVLGTEQYVDAGAQGEVYRYGLRGNESRPGFMAVVKFDDTGLGLNNPARAAGIPEANPQQSLRAVAVYQLSRMLKQNVPPRDIIPRTEFFVGTDDTGRPKLGQAMGFVNGSVGQRKVALREGNPLSAGDFAALGLTNDIHRYDSPDSSEEGKREVMMKLGKMNITKFGNQWYKEPYPISVQAGLAQRLDRFQATLQDPNSDISDKDGARNALNSFVKRDGRWYNATYLPPADVDYNDPVVQRGLSDLQLFDFIIGHADRNPGNWIFEKDATGRVIGVKGIDNDDTFGQNWSLPISKTPGIPPIVDYSTAQNILNANPADIERLLDGFSVTEKEAVVARFVFIKQIVQKRVDEGNLASLENIAGTRRWGGEQMAAAHAANNSYLGAQIAEKARGVALQQADQLV